MDPPLPWVIPCIPGTPLKKPSFSGTADEESVSADATNILHAGETHIVTDTSIEMELTMETLDVQKTSNSIGTMDVNTTIKPTPPGTCPTIPSPAQDIFFVNIIPEPV